MSRPSKKRRVCLKPRYNEFVVKNNFSSETINLTIDEFECLRLLDYEKITQEECAIKMMVARTTVTMIYQEARYKLMDALVNGKRLIISGGNFTLCSESSSCRGYNCLTQNIDFKLRKENVEMRIAVTYENGEIFQHFGKSQQFKIYDIEDHKIVDSSVVDTCGAGHGALAAFLSQNSVDLLICGGIGVGALNALSNIDIEVCSGVSGNADEAVNNYLLNKLNGSNNSSCSHHHHDDHECHCGHDHHHDDHECHCGHDHHHDDHECHCGHDHHHDDHQCHCGHDHHHDDHECHCGHHHDED